MDTFSEHIVNMASYNGYSLVVRDAMKWFNYQGERNRNVKTAIEEAYGTGIPKKDNGENKGSPERKRTRRRQHAKAETVCLRVERIAKTFWVQQNDRFTH